MTRIPRLTRRRWITMSLILGSLVAVAVGTAWWTRRDPWPVRVVIRPSSPQLPVGFTPDGRSFLTSNGVPRVLAAWDPATGQPQAPPAPPIVRNQSLARDGQSFVGVIDTARDSEVVWGDRASGAIRQRWPIPATHAFQPILMDGDHAVRVFLSSRGGPLEVATWDLATGATTRRPIAIPLGGTYQLVDMPARGNVWAALDTGANNVVLWDIAADRLLGRVGAKTAPRLGIGTDAVLTPGGQTLIIGRGDGQLEFWDVPSLTLTRTGKIPPGELANDQMVVAPDGQSVALTVVHDPTILRQIQNFASGLIPGWPVWPTHEVIVVDVATGQVRARSPGSIMPHFAPDGRTIATVEPDWSIAIRALPEPQHSQP